MGATLIDGLIIVVPAYIIGLAAGSTVIYYVLATLGQAVYNTLLIGGGGRTVGQMAVGTKTLDTNNGNSIGHGRALLRWFVTFVLGLTVIGGILDILWPLWDDKNQTIHDKAATSVVMLNR
ncbi:MAG: RDD family protein [Actinomycetota bacterium]|nr:RDD family protein [Actinomycetota bacterium]